MKYSAMRDCYCWSDSTFEQRLKYVSSSSTHKKKNKKKGKQQSNRQDEKYSEGD